MNRQREFVNVGNMNQGLRNGARPFGRAKAVLVFRNFFGNLQRVVANSAETPRDVLGSIIGDGGYCSRVLYWGSSPDRRRLVPAILHLHCFGGSSACSVRLT